MGHIVQYPASPTTTGSNDPAIRATHQLPRRRNRHRDQIRAALDRFDVHGLHPEDGIATRTKIKSGGCINAPRSVRHVEVLENRSGSLVAPDPPGPRPLPTTHRAETHTPHQNGEEPLKPLRTITINVSGHELIAEDPLTPQAREILDALTG